MKNGLLLTSGGSHGSDTKARQAYSAKIAFSVRVFKAFNIIIGQRPTFLIFFSIPGLYPIIITWKFKNIFLVKNWKKKKEKKSKGQPYLFLKKNDQIFFDFLGYSNWKLSKDTKND